MVRAKKTVNKAAIEAAIQQSRQPSRHGVKQSYKSISGRGGATAVVIDCTSTSKIGQEECLDRANNLAAAGCHCSSINNGTSCDCPEGDD
jgi:hypothetical protein